MGVDNGFTVVLIIFLVKAGYILFSDVLGCHLDSPKVLFYFYVLLKALYSLHIRFQFSI